MSKIQAGICNHRARALDRSRRRASCGGSQGRAALLAIGVALTLLAFAPRARAANDPKDLESQNAADGRVLQSTGQAHLRIEIEVPKGTGGSEPELALSYASHLADGPFGIGWRLELGEIRRSDRFGTPAYDDATDRFELDGVLLVAHPDAAGHGGEYRTREESFARIQRIGEGWLVEYPTGRKARFGTDQATRIRLDGSTDFERDEGPIGRWLLAELEDAHGNVVRFRYARDIDVGTAYPRAVEYSYRAGSDAPIGDTLRSVEFELEDREDALYGFPAGIETRIRKRVREIRSRVGDRVHRRLVLEYSGLSEYTTGRTRLKSAQLFGTDCALSISDPGASCRGLPARRFAYTDSDALGSGIGAQWEAFDWSGSASLHFTEGVAARQGRDRGVRIGDVNGDGYPDYLQAWLWEQDGLAGAIFDVYLNDGSGWGTRDAAWAAKLQQLTFGAHSIQETRKSGVTCSVGQSAATWQMFFRQEPLFTVTQIYPLAEARLVDLNADGFADIVLSYEIGAGSATTATPCTGTPKSWAASPQVKQVWINAGIADAEAPGAGWVSRDDWAQSLPPFYSIYLRSDGGSGASLPGSARPPGARRGSPTNVTNGVTFAHYFDHGVRMPDLNGDGRPDIVARRDAAHFGASSPVYEFAQGAWLSRADGVGWDHHPEYLPPVPLVAEFNYREASLPLPKYVTDADAGARFADLNGDGLEDLIKTRVHPLDGESVRHGPLGATLLEEGVWLNTGAGWCGSAEGCLDAQRYLPESLFTVISLVYWPVDGVWGGNQPVVRSAELALVDLNGDELVDLLKTDSHDLGGLDAWLHDPSAPQIWVHDDRFVPPPSLATTGFYQRTSGERFIFDSGVRIFDYDGDATVDLLRDREAVAREMSISIAAHADLLRAFDNGQGGRLELEYASALAQRDAALEDEANADAEDPQLGEAGSIGLPRWTARAVVSKLTRRDALEGGDSHATSMRYAMPRWDPEHRAQLGFRAVEATHGDGSTELSFFWQQPGRTGRVSRVLRYDAESALQQERTQRWEVIPGSEAEGSIAGALIGRLAGEATTRFYGPALAEAPGASQTTTYHYADPQTGQRYGYGFAHRIEHARATGRLVIDRVPEAANTASWIIGELARETKSDARGDLLERVEYDTLRGLPTAVRRSVAKRHTAFAAITAETRHRYDAFGNLVETTDAEGRSAYFCYDGDASFADGSECPDAMQTGSHTLLVGVLDPLREVTRFVRDPATAQVRELHREYSGDREGVEVDAFDRPLRAWVWPAGRAGETLLEARAYFDDPRDPANPAGRAFVERWSYVDADDPSQRIRTAVYRDGFGRELIDARPTPPGHSQPFARAIASRDHAGRPLRELLDTACADAHCSHLATDRDHDEIRSSYDALGRIRTRETPDGVAAFAYRQRSMLLSAGYGAGSEVQLDAVLAKDPAGNLSEYLLDGERLVAANECSNHLADPATVDLSQVSCLHPSGTFYSYEASGELAAIYDATRDYARTSHRIVYHYDTLGRPWLVEDPDAGARYSGFDRVGNVTQTQDARASSAISYEYDALDRLTRIDRPAGIGEWDLEIEYDHRTRKRASAISTGSYRESWEYDDFGNLSTNVRNVFDRTLRTDFVHDLLGRLRRRWLPLTGVEGVSLRYESAFLRAICSKLEIAECERAPGLFYVSNVEYDRLGRVSALAESPGELRFDYYTSNDPEPEKAVRRLKSARLGDGSLLDLTYRYGGDGQLVRIDDAHTGDALDASAAYGYDTRRRLRSWADAEGNARHFSYDVLGNLVGRELASASAAPNQAYAHPDKPHAITSNADGLAYAYDAAGNVTARGGERFHYNSLGQLVCAGSAESPCASGALWYDVDGALLSKTVGTRSEVYIGDFFRYDPGASTAWAGTHAFGRRIAVVKKAGVGLRAAHSPVLDPLSRPLARIDAPVLAQIRASLLLLGCVALLAVLAWPGAIDRVGDRPLTAALALGLAFALAAPPAVWAGVRGRQVAARTRYLFHDHLGSEILALDESGVAVERRVFSPFGRVIASREDTRASVPAAFTGKLQHGELGLYHFGARWYDDAAGRFVSVDPLLPRVSDPQTHNPYSYVRNDPIGHVDPDGRALEGAGAASSIVESLLLRALVSALGSESRPEAPLPLRPLGSFNGNAAAAFGASRASGADLVAELASSTALRYQTSLRERLESARARAEPRVGAIWRWPDFFSINVNVAIPNPWTGTLLGVSGAATLDENGELYVGLGGNVGSSLTVVSGSAAFGWLNHAAAPSGPQLQRFLVGRGFNASAGYWAGGAYSYSIDTGESSTSLGFFSPQAGVGYTYSWHVGDLWN